MSDEDQARAEIDMPYTLRIAKLMADELRIKVVAELNTREMSPKEFHEEFGGGSPSRVSRAFDLLTEFGWLQQTRTETGGKRRGAIEHFYRATSPAVFYNDVWGPLPVPIKETISGGIFEELGKRIRDAIEAGTIDARAERHLSWTPLLLDRQGWENVIARIDAIFEFLSEEQERASARLAETGGEPTPMTVALAAFESPVDTEQQPQS